MNRRFLIITAISAVFLGSWSVRGEDARAKKLAKAKAEFRKRMMESIGKKVTVTGTFGFSKYSAVIVTDEDEEVWVGKLRHVGKKPPNDSEDTRFTVTGKLEFHEKAVDPGVSGIPEHFYIRDGEVSVAEDSPK